jgi:hypothetical protein
MRRSHGFAALAAVLCLAGLGGIPGGLRAQAPADPDALIEAARAAGRDGRTRDAIRNYERAAALAPERAGEINAALAFQYAWAGDLDAADRAFVTARAHDPDNYDLWMGQALVANWKGDHLRAWRQYGRIALEHPERAEPWVGMAAAQNWAGRRDWALRSLAEAKRLDPGNRDAAGLDRTVRTSLRPQAGVFYDWSEDSDDYQVNGLWAEAGLFPHPQLQLIPFVNLVGIRRPAAADIDETWVGMTVVSRPVTRLGVWSRFAWLPDPQTGSNYTPVAGGLHLDWTANDRLRFGVSGDRFAVVSYRTLPDKITGEVAGTFVEVRPDWRSRVRVDADVARYRPVAGFAAIHRWNLSAAASRQVWAPVRLRAGASGRYLRFSESPDNGIWTPERFWALAGLLEWDAGDRRTWSVSGRLELGPAHERGADTSVFAVWQVGLFRALGGLLVDVTVGHTEGNVDTGTGYDRTYAHAGVRRRF